MNNPTVWTSKGILNPKAGEKKFQLNRHLPSADLAFFVERYWIIHWDLRGQEPFVQETLPYPCVNLVIEKGDSRIYGVMTGRFSQRLTDEGQVFGVKFKPGAFYPFINTPISLLTDKSLQLEEVFAVESDALEESVLSLNNEGKMIALVEDVLRARLPECDENVILIKQIVDFIIEHRDITKVDDVVSRLHLNKRTIQRLFNQYVGVSPKWVIQRYRLHEAAEQLAAGEVVDWPKMALELGYFDQAHFIKDFKNLVGKTPAEYAKDIDRSPTLYEETT